MEALHEEIYFNTLHFFDVMGRFTRGAGLAYPGRVIPLVHAKADGKPGRAKISVTGFDAARPSVVVEYVERDGRAGEARLDIPKVAVDRPQTLAALVRAGRDGIERLDLRVKVDTEKDERDELVKRADELRVDRTIMSAEQVARGRRQPRPAARRPASTATRSRIRISAACASPPAGSTRARPARKLSRRSIRTARPAPLPDIRKAAPPVAAAAAGRADRPVGHADPAARGLRDPGEDVDVQGSDRLQGRASRISARTSGRWT